MELLWKYVLYKPCNGMAKSKVATKITDDTPISCHKKYVIKSVCKGPIHR